MRTHQVSIEDVGPASAESAPLAIVTGLGKHGERYAGTDAERRAGNWLARRIRESGRKANVEPFHVHPGWFGIHATLALAGVVASLLGRTVPAAGFAIALVAATALHLDLGGRVISPRRLLFRRVSQNIVSPGASPDAATRVILCAAYDAPRCAGAAAPGFARLAIRAQELIRVPVGPFRVIFWSLALLLPILGARMAGIEGSWLAIAQIPSTIALVIAAFALAEAEISAVGPGANDNASGVAAALATAERLDRRPADDLDVWIALLGAGSTPGESIAALVRRHRDQLGEEAVLIVFDACGRGDLRFEASSGWTVSYEADAEALAACGRIVTAGGDDQPIAEPLRNGNGGHAYAAQIRGRRAITLGSRDPDGLTPGRRRPDDVAAELQPAAIERAAAFAESLSRELAAERAGE